MKTSYDYLIVWKRGDCRVPPVADSPFANLRWRFDFQRFATCNDGRESETIVGFYTETI